MSSPYSFVCYPISFRCRMIRFCRLTSPGHNIHTFYRDIFNKRKSLTLIRLLSLPSLDPVALTEFYCSRKFYKPLREKRKKIPTRGRWLRQHGTDTIKSRQIQLTAEGYSPLRATSDPRSHLSRTSAKNVRLGPKYAITGRIAWFDLPTFSNRTSSHYRF